MNECLTNNGGCDSNGICANTIGSRTCDCIDGYSGDGMSCKLATTENQSVAIGVGVGVTVGLLALLLLVLLILFFIRRNVFFFLLLSFLFSFCFLFLSFFFINLIYTLMNIFNNKSMTKK